MSPKEKHLIAIGFTCGAILTLLVSQLLRGSIGAASSPEAGSTKSQGLNEHQPTDSGTRPRSNQTKPKKIASPDNPIALIGANGRITNAAATNLGLSEDEIEELELMMKETLIKFEKVTADRAKVDKAKSDPENGNYSLRIRALDDQGASILTPLEHDILRKFGVEKGRLINKLISGAQHEIEPFAAFGKYDADIEIRPASNGSSVKVASVQYFDPTTGQKIVSSEMTISRFEEIYGKSLSDKYTIPEN